jgi:hypothetical protein
MAMILLIIVGGPVVPGIFNRLAGRLAMPFQEAGGPALPAVGLSALAKGLVLTGLGWLLLGASLWATVRALWDGPLPLTLDFWGRLTAYQAIAYVAGFVIVLIPNGIGIREFFLKVFLFHEFALKWGLGPADAQVRAIAAVILLRLVWLIAEIVIVTLLLVSWSRSGWERVKGVFQEKEMA